MNGENRDQLQPQQPERDQHLRPREPREDAALAPRDFNGDGYFDLAIGVPDRDVVSGTLKTDAGEVVILFGSAGGLTTTGHQCLNEASLSQGIETGNHFDATALCLFVTCYADLAIGPPESLAVLCGDPAATGDLCAGESERLTSRSKRF